MKKFLITLKDKIFSSYWATPATMVLISIGVHAISNELDKSYNKEAKELLQNFLFFENLSVETIRSYLSTLVGAIITVTGLVFSLTVLTVSSASAQFGPRVLNNFMRDRSNQLTLGVFTGTLVFVSTGLLSLDEGQGSLYIPYITILISYLLALICGMFLIFYIHHIPSSLRIENILTRIASSSLDGIGERFPLSEEVKTFQYARTESSSDEFRAIEESILYPINGSLTGYVQALDLNELVEVAAKEDVLIKLVVRPGDFVPGKCVFAYSTSDMTTEGKEKVISSYVIGGGRSLPQNLMFLISQIIEIAIRAMSPGINDPITAMSCMDWLEAILLKMMNEDFEGSIALDEDGEPRVLLRTLNSEELLFHMRKTLAQYMASTYATSIHMMESLLSLYELAPEKKQKEAIKACAVELMSFARENIPKGAQLDKLAERFETILEKRIRVTKQL